MNDLRVTRDGSGEIQIRGLGGVLLQSLYGLPEILREREQVGVRDRLFPDPVSNDDRLNSEWHETMDTDLHYLFASAEVTVVRDMATLSCGSIVFPEAHFEAWLSALNQARIILGELYSVDEKDMSPEDIHPENERDQALLQIHIYGYLLQLLVEA